MGAFHSALLGTLQPTFAIGLKAKQAVFDASGLTANRTLTVPDATGTLALRATTLAGYGITDAALDSAVVHDTGDETIAGIKTFTGGVYATGSLALQARYGASNKGHELRVDTTNPYAYYDFHTNNTAYLDYDARIYASGSSADNATAGGATLGFVAASFLFNNNVQINADLLFRAGTPMLDMLSPGAVYGYNILSNVSDTVDSGLLLRKWNGTTYDNVVQMTGDGLLLTPVGGASYPLRISGVLTGSGRTVQWDNNDTSAGAAMSLQMLAGASGNGQLTQFGTEYTATAALAGRTLLQNIGGTGLVLSAAAAGTDIQFWGASNAVLGKITSAGDLNMYGAAYWGDDKEIARFSDTWLRLNPGGDFTSGIYLGTGLVRNDGPLQVGTTSAAGFFVSTTQQPQWQGANLGFLGVLYAAKTAAYTFTTADRDKGAAKNTATAITFTLPTSPTAGDVYPFANINASGNLTIAPGTGGTLRLGGTATTGNRTVAPWGYGSATCIVGGASPVWLCSGAGVT